MEAEKFENLPYGLIPGEIVKFQRAPNCTKTKLTVRGIHRDGSISCHDEKGAFRAILPQFLEVERENARGKREWVKLIPNPKEDHDSRSESS